MNVELFPHHSANRLSCHWIWRRNGRGAKPENFRNPFVRTKFPCRFGGRVAKIRQWRRFDERLAASAFVVGYLGVQNMSLGQYLGESMTGKARETVYGPMPQWCWVSQDRDIPRRLRTALTPRSCRKIDADKPIDFLLSNRSEAPTAGQILVLDGSDGQSDVIQLWLRHLRRDATTSAMPILVWAHSGILNLDSWGDDDFRLMPDGVIGKSDWKAQDRWIDRVETILRKRLQRHFRIDVHLDMHSRMGSLERTSHWIMDCVRPVPWMAEKLGRLRQTIFELGGNAIEWGNHGDPEKTVHLRLRVDDRSLHVMVADQGAGFDRQNIPHAAAPDDPIRHLEIREDLGLREGGFGLMITRGLVDRMVYNSTGNTVLVTMRQKTRH